MQIVIFFCLVVGSFAQIDVNLSCSANSHYSTCATACPLTCDNYQNPPKVCTLNCKIGCQCDEGYVFASDGSCVLPENCPAQSKNVAKSCRGGPEPGLCDAYMPSWYYDTKSGTCKGFVYGGCGGNGNRYATEQECLQQCANFNFRECPANSHYSTCGTACPLTCENYQNPPKVCVLMCKIGCECDEGYVLAKDGSCVLPESCPTQAVEKSCNGEAETGNCRAYMPSYYFDAKSGTCKGFVYGGCGGNGNRYATEEECLQQCAGKQECPANSHYESCGTACPLTCDNYQNPPKVCVAMCKIGCQCDAGYVLAKDGSCVLPESCPAQAVEPSCSGEAETGECRAYMPSWYYDAKSGTCKGFVYGGCGGNGNRYATEEKCLQQCAGKQECPANSHYASCGTACPLTCDNYQNPPKVCVAMCKIGCQCDAGYVLAKDGSCVLPESCPAQAVEPSCSGEAETGLCRAYMPSWYYDAKSGTCKGFVYGGCGGNGNRYATEEKCLQQCAGKQECPANSHYASCGTACPLTCDNYKNPPKVCTYNCKIGCECDAGYVLAKDGSCVLPESCPAQDLKASLNVCDLPAETGVCKALFRRYAFDRTTGQCRQFVYGGCGGNENNFRTIEECESACPVQRALDRPDCDKKAESGNCLAYIPRYYYDQEEGMCKKFIYGGCGGNRNNFATEFECYNKCGALVAPKVELCEQEAETGLCRGYFPRYYFNKQTGECEKFIYGGCGGNKNNFSSKDNCEQVCKA